MKSRDSEDALNGIVQPSLDVAAAKNAAPRPLADRMRPETLEEFGGQEHILAPGKPLRTQIEKDKLASIILWGPPGAGKTTLAHIIAKRTQGDFVPFSAVTSGIKEIKTVLTAAERSAQYGRRTILFIDEIHRFNKAQQGRKFSALRRTRKRHQPY